MVDSCREMTFKSLRTLASFRETIHSRKDAKVRKKNAEKI